jgi:hypothetical protein
MDPTAVLLFLLVPLLVAGALVALGIYTRGGRRTAYGYALDNSPRRRREVRPWVLTLLRPLFVYNHHRHAYVLRVIGNRRGPVLKSRAWAPTEGEAGPAELLPGPRAPVGARGVPPAKERRETPELAEAIGEAPRPGEKGANGKRSKQSRAKMGPHGRPEGFEGARKPGSSRGPNPKREKSAKASKSRPKQGGGSS